MLKLITHNIPFIIVNVLLIYIIRWYVYYRIYNQVYSQTAYWVSNLTQNGNLGFFYLFCHWLLNWIVIEMTISMQHYFWYIYIKTVNSRCKLPFTTSEITYDSKRLRNKLQIPMNVINDVVKDSLYENNEQTERLADNVATSRLKHRCYL